MFRPLPVVVLLLFAGTVLARLLGPPGPGALAEEEKKVPRCSNCHETSALAGTSHEVLAKTRAGAECLSCHDAGLDHALSPEENPVMKGLSADRVAEICAACHGWGPDHVRNWKETTYAREGKSCGDCHVVHAASDAHLSFEGDAKGYLGDAACRMCHQGVFESFERSFHAGVVGKTGGGCEACHGAGREHALVARALARGSGEPRIAAEPAAEACLLCHRAIPDRHAREMEVYREKRAACAVCHDVHVDRADPVFAEEGDPRPVPTKSVGSAVCSDCHVLAVKSASGSVHASLLEAEGCERCHGPAGAHVASGGRSRFIVNPEKGDPQKASGLCLDCHDRSPDHARDWRGGPLASQGLSCLTCHGAHEGPDGQGRPVAAAAGPDGAARNVGSKTCAVCHQNPHPEIERSPHAALVLDRETGCESCHGPGSAHVASGGKAERIRSPSRMEKNRQAGFCLSCHGREEGLISWNRGEHARADLTCTTCHDSLKSEENASVKRDPDLCAACHREVEAKFRLPNHHPLERGAVQCTSCHDPHGDPARFLNLDLRKERCVECHRNYRGPFLHEHEADRTDGCVICHQPHGSPNRRLLTHHRVSDLCIQCHVTPASHNLAGGSAFRNCLNCHGSIHGSYVDEKFFR